VLGIQEVFVFLQPDGTAQRNFLTLDLRAQTAGEEQQGCR